MESKFITDFRKCCLRRLVVFLKILEKTALHHFILGCCVYKKRKDNLFHWIITTFAPRVATAHPLDPEPSALERAIFGNSPDHVLGASGGVSASRWQEW